MPEHYFVAADQGHLRIFRERMDPGQRDVALDAVESMDFPAGVKVNQRTEDLRAHIAALA